MKTRKTTKLVFNNLMIPLVTFRLGDGTEGSALVDSGSESTMIDLKFVKEHKKLFKITKTNLQIEQIGFSGKSTTRIVKLTTSVFMKTFRGKKFFRSLFKDAMLTDLSSVNKGLAESRNMGENAVQAILGSVILKKLQAEINYRNNTLTVNSEE